MADARKMTNSYANITMTLSSVGSTSDPVQCNDKNIQYANRCKKEGYLKYANIAMMLQLTINKLKCAFKSMQLVFFSCCWNKSLLLTKVELNYFNTFKNAIYSCDDKAVFSASLLQSLELHDLSQIIQICWFGAQETFLLIINVENNIFLTT